MKGNVRIEIDKGIAYSFYVYLPTPRLDEYMQHTIVNSQGFEVAKHIVYHVEYVNEDKVSKLLSNLSLEIHLRCYCGCE